MSGRHGSASVERKSPHPGVLSRSTTPYATRMPSGAQQPKICMRSPLLCAVGGIQLIQLFGAGAETKPPAKITHSLESSLDLA